MKEKKRFGKRGNAEEDGRREKDCGEEEGDKKAENEGKKWLRIVRREDGKFWEKDAEFL